VPSFLRRLFRAPALHFLALGGLLFAVQAGWRAWTVVDTVPTAQLVITAAQVEQLRRDLTLQNGYRPSPRALRTAIEAAIDEEVLYREALATGLDRGNEMIRQRLVQIAGFVAESPDQDEQALYETALRLGLDRSDVVVRRQLAEFMRLAARNVALEGEQPPDDWELEGHLQRHLDQFAQPWRVRLTQLYLSEDRRGDAAEGDARHLLDEIRAGRVTAEAALEQGDPFLLGDQLPWQTGEALSELMGPDFAHGVAELPPGEWSGPLRSGYGWHLVLVDAVRPAMVPSLDVVRDRVLQAVLEERREWRLWETLKALRARYAVRVEDSSLAPAMAEVRG
jgi:parvulin-like peptidyl-prolyl isomerase